MSARESLASPSRFLSKTAMIFSLAFGVAGRDHEGSATYDII